MKKSVFILNNLDFGGVQKTVINLANEMHLRDVEVEIVVLQQAGLLAKQRDPEIKVSCFESKNHIISFWKLRNYLKENQPDVLFANLFVPNTLSLLAGWSIPDSIKIVLGIHNTYSKETRSFPYSIIEYYIVKYLFPFANGINICSHEAAEDLRDTFKRGFDNLHVIYNPVISADINKQALEKIEHPWFQDGEPPVILGIGRITKQKDFVSLIRAFHLLNDKMDARLVILGDGPEKSVLSQLVQYYNLEDKVELMGFVQNPYKFIAAASLFVLSSIYEGLPTVLIEAGYLGCRIVSTACKSGPKEILFDGKYGVLVPVGDPVEMALAMEHQLKSPTVAVDTNWSDLFSVNTILDQYISLYLS